MGAACRSSVADLRDLADRLAALAVEHTGPQAILLTGSVARGDADEYSDVDLIVYYDALPDEAARESIRTGMVGETRVIVAEHVPDAEIAVPVPIGARQEPRPAP